MSHYSDKYVFTTTPRDLGHYVSVTIFRRDERGELRTIATIPAIAPEDLAELDRDINAALPGKPAVAHGEGI